ncbi:MAG TPA: sulfotransferase [Caulobacteraceae bacterium]|jgi:tetratricopeptide (TPR) repeat protein|nr:sulfotransferase [Caulobacteraceae bacterium]
MAGAKSQKRIESEAATRAAEFARIAAFDLGRATDMAEAAKADGLQHPTVHLLIGLRLRDQGRLEAAIEEFGLGLQLDAEHAPLMTEVGVCLLELGRRREAGRVLGVAVKLAPQAPRTNFAYGWAAERLGSLDAAESGFKRAIAFDPNYADALAGLSGLAVRRREWADARGYAQRAAAIDPRQTDALMNLARADLGEGEPRRAEQRLREIISLPHLNPQARTNARFVLGDALDAQKRYAEAFAVYAEGKAEMREQFAAAFGGARENAAYEGAREILAEFLDAPADAWAARAPSPPPVEGEARGHAFLVGFPRSGTTLLEQVLATHPDIVDLDERPVLIDAESEFLTVSGGVRRLAEIDSARLAPFRQAYWARVREFGVEPAGKVFIDKHPLSTIRLPLISKVFPAAKVIFALRDPRDVVLSCFRRSFNMNAAMYAFNTLEGAARYYDAVMTAGEVYLEKLPFAVQRIRYEDLVADFDGQAGALCDFLGVPRTEALRDFAATAARRRVATPSSTQVGRGLYGEGVGQWRNYAEALAPALPILTRWVEKFGYEPD